MATAEYVLGSLSDMDRYVRMMSAATGVDAIVNAVNDYLSGWSKMRIENLQRVDGGWGPFDDRQQQTALSTLADVSRLCDSVRRQYVALREVGIEPTPELLELDLFLFFARQIIEDRVPVKSQTQAGALSRGGRMQRMDSRSLEGRF